MGQGPRRRGGNADTFHPYPERFFGIAKIADTMSEKEEREGPTEEILQKYAAYMRSLLREAGFAK